MVDRMLVLVVASIALCGAALWRARKDAVMDDLRWALDALTDVRGCTACSARAEAICPIPGIGAKTGIVFVGRNPGAQEDFAANVSADGAGRPFIGPAGQVMDRFLSFAGLERQDVFLTNLVLCHTYDDRPPTPHEITVCTRRHLFPQLAALDPYLVVGFGAEAARAIGGVRSLAKLHGSFLRHRAGFWFMPAYHPAAMLHDSRLAVEIEFDAVQVRRFLDRRATMQAQLKEPFPDAIPGADPGTRQRRRGGGRARRPRAAGSPRDSESASESVGQ